MNIGVIAKFIVREEMTKEFEAAMRTLMEKVRANESGNLCYSLCKSRTEENVYKMIELYAHQEALTQHGQTKHFQAAGGLLRNCLAARPEIEYLDGI